MILKRTVEEFNGAIRRMSGSTPRKLDGRCTEGITPKKSHWADTLDKPPLLRVRDHRRRDVYLRRIADQHPGAGVEYIEQSDSRSVRLR